MTSQSVPSQGNAVVSMTAQHDDGIPRSGIASSATAAGGVPWSQAFNPQAAASPANARRRSEQRYLRSTIVAFLLFTMAFAVLFTPFILQQHATEKESQVADAAASHVMGWPSSKAERMFAQARAYNRRLASSGQPVIGEAADPFAPTSSGSSASDATANTTEAWRHDTEYLSLLNVSHGVMGSIRIPKISVNLPIYHGTSDAVLDDGVGHVYGTSLPVGGTQAMMAATILRIPERAARIPRTALQWYIPCLHSPFICPFLLGLCPRSSLVGRTLFVLLLFRIVAFGIRWGNSA